MVRLAVLLVDDPGTAEDVVQEAFTGLHRHWAGLRDEAAAVAYLRTAVVNGSRSVLRRRRTARDYVPPHQVNARSAESLAMLSAEHQAVVDALGTLPPRQREVLVLRYYGGMSEAEIADATGHQPGHREVDREPRAGRRAAVDGRPSREGLSRERADDSAQRIREAPTERRRGSAVSGEPGPCGERQRGTGGRDGEAGAAERRLAEALRAQASLGARTSAAPGAPAPVEAARPEGRQARSPGQKPPGQKQRGPESAWGATGPTPARQGRAGAQSPVGQSGPHGRAASRGRPARRAASRRSPATGRPAAPATRPAAPGRATTSSRRRRSRPPSPGRPRRPPRSSRPPSRAAPAGPPRAPRPRPRRSPRRRPAARGSWTSGCAWRCSSASSRALSSGCALALLSVLDPGLLPALG